MNKEPRLFPAPACLLCGTCIEAAGGRRLYASQSRGVSLAPGPPRPETEYRRVRSEPFAADSALRVNVWGEPDRFDDAVFDRARALFDQGVAPWFCQACGDRTCGLCGAPLLRPHGYDFIEDDGSTKHVAPLGGVTGCSNRECVNCKMPGRQ